MALNYGIKVTRAGYSTSTNDPRQLLMSSAYPMFKYHNEYTVSATFNPGDQTATASVTHGLGYVPAFMAYGVRDDDNANFIIPSIPYAISEFDFAEAWADDDKIYFKVTLFDDYIGQGWNELIYNFSDYWSSFDSLNDHWSAGATDFAFGGAFRFTGIALTNSQAITSATITVGVTAKAGNTDIKMNHWGIDEDSTADFSSDPMGRTKTTATLGQDLSAPATPFGFDINVKNMVEEIIARGSWSSGNAIGFITNDNGSAADTWIVARYSTNTLTILKPGTLTVDFRAIVFKDRISV